VPGEEFTGDFGEFGGDAEGTAVFSQLLSPGCQIGQGAGGLSFWDGQVEGAGAKAKFVVQGEDVLGTTVCLFRQNIQSRKAKINAALPHSGNDVARSLKHHRKPRQAGDGGLILAWIGSKNLQTARFQKIESVFVQGSFAGQGQPDVCS
jgi:hypothetical protein